MKPYLYTTDGDITVLSQAFNAGRGGLARLDEFLAVLETEKSKQRRNH
jgi:hypothetical protein